MQIDNILNIGRESYKADNLNIFGEIDSISFHFLIKDDVVFETKGKDVESCRQSLFSFIKSRTVCFTGHRKMLSDKSDLHNKLMTELNLCYRKGFRYFITGGAKGFDTFAAQRVIEFKKTHEDVLLIIAVPFKDQAAKFNEKDKKLYDEILEKADFYIVLSEEFFDGCYLRRNDYMIGHSSHIIAYWDGKRIGGTSYTCRKALAKADFGFHNLL